MISDKNDNDISDSLFTFALWKILWYIYFIMEIHIMHCWGSMADPCNFGLSWDKVEWKII